MPRYHIKKPTQTETREEIETSSNKYLLTSRESEYSTMIYIGGLDSWCLECQIIRENPVANMPKIEYDERCSLSGRFVPCESYKLGLFSDYGPSAHNTKMPNLNVHGSRVTECQVVVLEYPQSVPTPISDPGDTSDSPAFPQCSGATRVLSQNSAFQTLLEPCTPLDYRYCSKNSWRRNEHRFPDSWAHPTYSLRPPDPPRTEPPM